MSFKSKEAAREYARNYRSKNRAKVNQYAHDRRARNPELAREKERAWVAKNRERVNQQKRQLRLANRDRINKRDREHYALNRKSINATKRAQRLANVEHYRAKVRRLYWKHVERRRADSLKYVRAKHGRRLARLVNAPTNLTGINEWMWSVQERPLSTCYFCKHIISAIEVEFDHVIPLSRGGEHSVRNLAISCLPCNRSKSNKTPSEWDKFPQMLLDL